MKKEPTKLVLTFVNNTYRVDDKPYLCADILPRFGITGVLPNQIELAFSNLAFKGSKRYLLQMFSSLDEHLYWRDTTRRETEAFAWRVLYCDLEEALRPLMRSNITPIYFRITPLA